MATPSPENMQVISRQEFEEFIHVLTHEIRNQLNVIGLEAADLAEQVEDTADARRLQEKVRNSAAFLKDLRDLLLPENTGASALSLPEITARMQARKLSD